MNENQIITDVNAPLLPTRHELLTAGVRYREQRHEKINHLCAKLNERDNQFENFGPRQFTNDDVALDQEVADFLRCLDEQKGNGDG